MIASKYKIFQYFSNFILQNITVMYSTPSLLGCGVRARTDNDSSSFFYHPGSKTCVLLPDVIHNKTELVQENGYQYWIKEGISGSYLTECGDAPDIPRAVVQNITQEPGGYYRAYYRCNSPFYTNGSISYTDCNPATHQWNNLQMNCSYIESCEQIKLCNQSYQDGEYWLYPALYGYKPVKIYCLLLRRREDKSAVEFVTLHRLNEFKTPKGEYYGPPDECNVNETAEHPEYGHTVHDRVKIDLEVGEARTTGYFARIITGAKRKMFTRAVGCSGIDDYPNCTLRGSGLIDITDTGFKLKSTNRWKSSSHINMNRAVKCSIVERTDHRVVMRGDGYCGGCYSDDVIFDLDPDFLIPTSAATVPVCD